jgi:hypothetical protein
VARRGGATLIRFRLEVGWVPPRAGRVVHRRATVLLLVPLS